MYAPSHCRLCCSSGLELPLASKACSRLALVYVIGRINKKKAQRRASLTKRRAISTVNGCLVADKLSFLSLEVRSCDIVHVTAVEAKDCLRATDHVPTGSVTQRSITLACNGLHLPHSRTITATSRKAEHEERVKARVKSTCFSTHILNQLHRYRNQRRKRSSRMLHK